MYIYIYVVLSSLVLLLLFNIIPKIFHTIPFLHKSFQKWLIFWASNHDVNWCLANWALLVKHQMPGFYSGEKIAIDSTPNGIRGLSILQCRPCNEASPPEGKVEITVKNT